MNMTHTEILSAFVDGESIDVAALAEALEDAGARAALVDFVRMREATRDVTALPATLHHLREPRVYPGAIRWTAAAAVLLLVFVAGLLVPLPGRGDASDRGDIPPAPVRLEQFVPGVDWYPGD